jgi:hypothetical protein
MSHLPDGDRTLVCRFHGAGKYDDESRDDAFHVMKDGRRIASFPPNANYEWEQTVNGMALYLVKAPRAPRVADATMSHPAKLRAMNDFYRRYWGQK